MEIVLGALVVIGVFVFWCDLTDSWRILSERRLENANPPLLSPLFSVAHYEILKLTRRHYLPA